MLYQINITSLLKKYQRKINTIDTYKGTYELPTKKILMLAAEVEHTPFMI
jgi:hypothetical protein